MGFAPIYLVVSPNTYMKQNDSPRIIIRIRIRTKYVSFNMNDIACFGKMKPKDAKLSNYQQKHWSYVWVREFEMRKWDFDVLFMKLFKYLDPRTKEITALPNHWQKQISLIAYSENNKLPGLVIKPGDLIKLGNLGFDLDVDWY